MVEIFGSTRFGERFRDGQYILVSSLFAVLLLTVPLVPCGVGATAGDWKKVTK